MQLTLCSLYNTNLLGIFQLVLEPNPLRSLPRKPSFFRLVLLKQYFLLSDFHLVPGNNFLFSFKEKQNETQFGRNVRIKKKIGSKIIK